jgi:hypothetical protein
VRDLTDRVMAAHVTDALAAMESIESVLLSEVQKKLA